MVKKLFSFLFLIALATPAFAQSQAANGAIEGTIVDSSGGVLPGVTVTLTNIDTGAERSVVTNDKGLYRAPLLTLGTYRVVAELPGFKKFEQTGIKLSVGQTAVVNVAMGVGALNETVTVLADSPLLDPARIDIGHTLSDLEVHNLPLVARNPYNFALAQPGVTGIGNVEFGVPRLQANGAAMRINYQIDGNTNTEKDRAGLRLLPMSEVMIQEVKVVTTGFAPEFGQTMGMVFNAVTPSGTNTFKGEGSYLFRRRNFSAFPFFFGCSTIAANCQPAAAGSVKPDTRVDTGTAMLGGPIARNKAFFYLGWEQTRRDLSSGSTINQSVRDLAPALGLKAQPTVVPNIQTAQFFIAKSDYQLSSANRATVRWLRFHNNAPYNSGGGINTMERATDFLDAMDSVAGQVVTTLGASKLNEFRTQFAHRHQSSVANTDSGSCPSITVTGIVGFGCPMSGTGQGNAGFDFKQKITQVIDNFTYIRAAHSYKVGFDWQHIYDERTNAPQFVFNFPSVAAYQAAKNGTAPFGYSTMTEITGNLGFNMATNIASIFVQDDWQIRPSLKILYGLRYDLYKYPAGLADAPLVQTQSFNTDSNNWGPRLGLAWSIDPQTVVRASTGIMYDQAILGGYEQAIALSGAASRAKPYTFNATSAGAPAFPNHVTTGTLNITPWAVDPEFIVAHTWQANAQVEREFARDFTTSVAVMYAKGSDLPVITDVNLINPVGTLADGRPIYSTVVSSATRLDPRFNHVMETQSLGSSTYKSVTIQATKRLKQGLTFNVQYSLGKGLDNTPLLTQLTVQAEAGRTDPSNIDRDLGPNPLDMRHSFNGNILYTSQSSASNRVMRALLAGNQFGAILQFNSGLPVNIPGNRDLNGDGVVNDRPLGIARNSLYLAPQKNVDLRYTRWIPLRGSARAEVIAELKNVFNTELLAGITTTTVVDAFGNPVSAIPSDPYQFTNPTSGEQRKFQLGFKVRF
jgi:carboxypeptidase family protein/TonB-dependent receptor-like protein